MQTVEDGRPPRPPAEKTQVTVDLDGAKLDGPVKPSTGSKADLEGAEVDGLVSQKTRATVGLKGAKLDGLVKASTGPPVKSFGISARAMVGKAGKARELDELLAKSSASLFQRLQGWGRYRLVKLLGQGGMGCVYLARDRRLHREVAIKFIREQGAVRLRDILREARAQARLEHPNICRVYEAGEVEGWGYIAMQLIRGKELGKVAREMTLEEKVLLFQRVAEALHSAHRQGIVHRDIKPANIMVERDQDGTWIPYVTDFGLARVVGDPGVTRTGIVVGTPAYMSPEQAKGEVRALDRRCDVYSLGATLYTLLAHKKPFPGTSVLEVLQKVLFEDPPLMRSHNPGIPADLDAVVLRCMEKSREKRYPSARALAEDLGRFLDGDPVEARQVTYAYRLGKKIRRHWLAVTLSTLAVLLVVAAVSFGLYNRWQAERQALLAQRFGQLVHQVETHVRFVAHVQPLHPIENDRESIKKKLDEIRRRMKELGSFAAGPGNYALGRGQLALGNLSQARNYLETAWNGGYKAPEVARTLGRTLMGLYERERRKLRFMGGKQRKALEKKLEIDLRKPAVEFLGIGRQTGSEEAAYDDAQIAYLNKDYDETTRFSREILQKMPWFYEASQLQGKAYVARAWAKGLRKQKLQIAEKDLNAALELLQETTNLARSYPDGYEALCRVYDALMELRRARGKPLGDAYEGLPDRA